MSDAVEIIDEFVYHAHIQERFKTAQSKKIRRYIGQLNKAIADYLRKKKTLETRKDYSRAAMQIKSYVKDFQSQLLKIIEKDIRGQFRAELEWTTGTIPDELNRLPAEDRVVNDAFFKTFNSVYTIETWLEMIGTRIFRCWDGQMRVATQSKAGMDWVIEQVLGE